MRESNSRTPAVPLPITNINTTPQQYSWKGRVLLLTVIRQIKHYEGFEPSTIPSEAVCSTN